MFVLLFISKFMFVGLQDYSMSCDHDATKRLYVLNGCLVCILLRY